MRIPLDYYRILGVPIQATSEQLTQAYQDRSLQMPRSEYSDLAIDARKQLLEEAYKVLSNSEKRGGYNASFLERTYEFSPEPESKQILTKTIELTDALVESQTPWLEIRSEQFVGALLIMQELGEYELVLRLGLPYLRNLDNTDLNQGSRENDSNSHKLRGDIVLSLALAYLELGREEWQQNKYENAATSGQMGLDLLLREDLFPSVREEIQVDLCKLRPYLILESLSLNEDNPEKRTKGLQLLQQMLQERGGIDGTGEDKSGLSIDEFLRFIQQLRSYLSSAEQQEMFEAEAQRPSAVGAYLAIYALLAKGFAYKQPALIVRAQEMLENLGKRQDVYLEQAVCALLLGQTDSAGLALEQSQECEPLAFIREHSQGSPDLLPGLCLYSERWLQTEVFCHCRDLANQQASLQEYFDDRDVQNYLEKLSGETSFQQRELESQPIETSKVKAARKSQKSQQIRKPSIPQSVKKLSLAYANIRSRFTQKHNLVSKNTSNTSPLTEPALPFSNGDIFPFADARQNLFPSSNGQSSQQQQSRESMPEPSLSSTNRRQTRANRKIRRRRLGLNRRRQLPRKTQRLLLLGIPLCLGLGVLGFSYKWFEIRSGDELVLEPTPSENINQISLNPVNSATLDLVEPEPVNKSQEILSREDAIQVIQTWLQSKSQAFGSNHKIEQLNGILADPILSQWRDRAKYFKDHNAYRQYQHTVEVASVTLDEQNPDRATVQAKVREAAKYYQNGQFHQNHSYDSNLLVRYDFVRQQDRWLIQKIEVLP
ncbi:MAG: IMS domain-containing protein [Prochloraceae cyanobacterium]